MVILFGQVVAGQQAKGLGFEPDVSRSTRLGRQTGGEHDVRGPVRRPVGEHGEADAAGADPMTLQPKCDPQLDSKTKTDLRKNAISLRENHTPSGTVRHRQK